MTPASLPRLEMPSEDALTQAQAQVVAEVVAGKRGKVPAPMIAWLRNPELARRGQKLGELLRYDTTLPPSLSELAILVCGRHWTSHHEWTAHKRIALAAGLGEEMIAAIAARRRPRFERPRQELVHDIASTLLAQGRIDDDLYDRGRAELGDRGLVELVGLVGYYSWVALTLNAFRIGLPASYAPELSDSPADGGPGT